MSAINDEGKKLFAQQTEQMKHVVTTVDSLLKSMVDKNIESFKQICGQTDSISKVAGISITPPTEGKEMPPTLGDSGGSGLTN